MSKLILADVEANSEATYMQRLFLYNWHWRWFDVLGLSFLLKKYDFFVVSQLFPDFYEYGGVATKKPKSSVTKKNVRESNW